MLVNCSFLKISQDLFLSFSDFLGFLHRNQELTGPDSVQEEVDYLRMVLAANKGREQQFVNCEGTAGRLLAVYQGLRDQVLSR
jgi:hypothetical protein